MIRKRHILSLLLILSLLFSLFSCGEAPLPTPDGDKDTGESTDTTQKPPATDNNEDEKDPQGTQRPENYHPLLWKVSDEAGNYIYVFASLPAGKEEIYPLPSAVWTAYYDSVHFLAERDIYTFESLFEKIDDQEAQNTLIAYYKKMMYLDNTIESHLTKETYNAAVSLFTANNLTHKLYEYYNPVFWVEKLEEIVVRSAGLTTQNGTDYHMIRQAITDNKFIALTDMGEKEAMLSLLSDKLQEKILLPYLGENAMQTKTDQAAALYSAWIEGNAQELALLCPSLFTEIPDAPAPGQTPSDAYAMYSEYLEKYLTPITDDMYGQVKTYLDGGYTVFTALDPSWLLGEDGFMARFAADGYTVTPIDTAA